MNPNWALISLLVISFSWYVTEKSSTVHTERRLAKIVRVKPGAEQKLIGGSDFKYFDPFISATLYKNYTVSGLIDTPYRGIDIVYYVLQGEIMYEDSKANSMVVSSGQAVWSTAGKGLSIIWFPLTPDTEVLELAINSVKHYKLIDSRFQFIQKLNYSTENVYVNLIAGESLGRVSATIARQGTYFIELGLPAGQTVLQDLPYSWNAFIYVLEGEVVITQETLSKGEIGVLSRWDWEVFIESRNNSKTLLIAGDVVDELLVQQGKLVMENYQEIQKTLRDYHKGKNGFQGVREWKEEIIEKYGG